MAKIPEYTLRAITEYNKKFERKAVNVPIGTTERIRVVSGKSFNSFAVAAILEKLEQMEVENNGKDF